MKKSETIVVVESGAGAKNQVEGKVDDPFALIADFSTSDINWSGRLFDNFYLRIFI